MSSIPGKSLYLSSFDIRTISNCALWLDAADTSTLTYSGVNITQWKDKSSNAYVFSNAGTVSTTTYNGRNVLTMAAGQRMTYATFPWRNLFTQISVISGNSGFLTSGWNVGGNFYRVLVFSGNTPLVLVEGTNYFRDNTAAPIVSNAYYMLITGYNTGSSLSPYSLNGTARTATIYSGSGAGDATYTDPMYINGNNTSSSFGSNNVAEIIHFNRSLTVNEYQQIEAYLSLKWGGIANLPVTHPYKNAPLFVRPFTPLDISTSSPNFWYDSTDSTTITATGTTLTAWTTKGSEGYYNAASSTIGVNLGTASTGTTTQNSLNTVSLPSGTRLLFGLVSLGGQGRSRFIATRPTVNTTTTNLEFINQNLLAGSRDNYVGISNSTLIDKSSTGGTRMQTSTIANQSNAFNLYTFVSSNTTTSNIISLNGTNQALAVNNASITLNINAASNYINATGGQQLGEWIHYPVSLSVDDIRRVEGYLAWKWGVVSNLPSTHTFKLFPPLVPSFSPPLLGGLRLWIDAADGTTVTLTSGTVSSVRDKSSNNLTFSNGTGFTYNVTKFNSSFPSFYNASAFTTRRIALFTAGLNIPQPFNMYFVGSRISNANLSTIITNNVSGPTFDAQVGGAGSTNNIIGGGGTSNILMPLTGTSNAFLIRFSLDSGSGNLTLNGDALNTVTGTGLGTNGFTTGNTIALGGSIPGSGGSNSWNGHFCELLAYSGAHSVQSMFRIEGYLAHKWGLVNLLPSTHPYKKFRP